MVCRWRAIWSVDYVRALPTTKIFLAQFYLSFMRTKSGIGWKKLLLPILFAGSFILSFPAPAAASPPFLPMLSITAPDAPTPPGSDLIVTIHWDRDDSYWVPPDQVSVTLYAIPEGTSYATWLLDRLQSPGKSMGETADYSLTVPDMELPAGSFMMIAVDPFSGAISRKAVVLHGSKTSQADIPATSLTKDFLHMPKLDPRLFS